MSKLDKIVQLILLFLELITWLLIAKYQSPYAFIAVGIMIVVIDIILVDIAKDKWYYNNAKQLHIN